MSSASRYTYLGPEGTFTEAALRSLPEAATRELVPMVSVPAALDAVRGGEAGGALVPIENSVEGGITATLDELAFGEPLMIYREVLLPIAFALLVRPGTDLTGVKTVTGHPAAQIQVRQWLAEHLPDAVWESAASNADGARLVQEGRFDGAFAGSSPRRPTASKRWPPRSMTRRTRRRASCWPAARPGWRRRPAPTRPPRSSGCATTIPVRCLKCCRSSRSAGST